MAYVKQFLACLKKHIFRCFSFFPSLINTAQPCCYEWKYWLVLHLTKKKKLLTHGCPKECKVFSYLYNLHDLFMFSHTQVLLLLLLFFFKTVYAFVHYILRQLVLDQNIYSNAQTERERKKITLIFTKLEYWHISFHY